MNIGQIITAQNYAISPTDSKRHILDKMADLRLAQLPVVKDGLFLGLVSYEALSVQEHMDESIQQASIPYDPVHLYDTQHI